MTASQNIVEIPGILQERTCKKVVFSGDGIIIGRPLSLNKEIFIPNDEIAAFRFGIKELKGYKFVFGYQYFIEIKNFRCEVYRIKLNSVYGYKRREYYKIWADLLQNFWDFYMNDQLNYYTEMYNIQQMFDLAGVTFLPDGISWDKNNYLPWNKIAIKSYQKYFMVHHADDPKQYKCCVFSYDWNAVVLQSLLKDIITEHARVRTLRRGL